MSLVVRPAVAADLEQTIELLGEAGLPSTDLTSSKLALVAEKGDVFQGAIGLENYGENALLRSLVVAKGARGGGVGPALVQALETLCGAAGIGRLWLLTIDADPFFAKLGYERKSRSEAPSAIQDTQEFSGLCPDDAVLMMKDLPTSGFSTVSSVG